MMRAFHEHPVQNAFEQVRALLFSEWDTDRRWSALADPALGSETAGHCDTQHKVSRISTAIASGNRAVGRRATGRVSATPFCI